MTKEGTPIEGGAHGVKVWTRVRQRGSVKPIVRPGQPGAGDHQVNVRLLAVLALFFLILTLSLFYLKQRRRAQAGGAGSTV